MISKMEIFSYFAYSLNCKIQKIILMKVRVRFAPSPTGFLHVGGLRTALYNFLFARKNGGSMILRIEDTDRTRLVENATENLIDSLKWAGIEYDEGPDIGGDFGPYVQSERLDIYKKYVNELIDSGNAYYAFDTQDEIAAMRQNKADSFDTKYDRKNMKNQFTLSDEKTQELIKNGSDYVIRLNVPENREVLFHDMIRGEVRVNTNDIDDQILLKSDGFPTYHLANVVDDYTMKISHVIRGEEWLPSTPKHVLLYTFFGWEIPQFAHLPLLLNHDKSKLSKRQGSVAVEDFRDKGYLRDAFVNFIALLGWNPTSDREIYTMNELIELFILEKVNKGGAVFDTAKLDWMQQQYLKDLPAETLGAMLEIELFKQGHKISDSSKMAAIAHLFRERVIFVSEIPIYADYMFTDDYIIDDEYLAQHWNSETLKLINPLIEIYRNAVDFSHDELASVTKGYAKTSNKKMGEIIHPLRLMLTGKPNGAGMFDTMQLIGKEKSLKRFDDFIAKYGV